MPFPFLLYYCVLLFLFGFHILLLSIIYFNSSPLNYHHHIVVFSLCPLEVNLHTYLTIWLRSCPMRIFFRFLAIFYSKIKNHKQSATYKMCKLKIKSHQVCFFSTDSSAQRPLATPNLFLNSVRTTLLTASACPFVWGCSMISV